AEAHAIDSDGVPPEGEDLLAPLRVPDPHRLVHGGAGDALAVGAEAHALDLAGVPPEGEDLLPLLRVPDPHRLVIGGAGDALAVGAEAHARDRAGVLPEDLLVTGEEGGQVVVLPAAQVPARRVQVLPGRLRVIGLPLPLRQRYFVGIDQSLRPV